MFTWNLILFVCFFVTHIVIYFPWSDKIIHFWGNNLPNTQAWITVIYSCVVKNVILFPKRSNLCPQVLGDNFQALEMSCPYECLYLLWSLGSCQIITVWFGSWIWTTPTMWFRGFRSCCISSTFRRLEIAFTHVGQPPGLVTKPQ